MTMQVKTFLLLIMMLFPSVVVAEHIQVIEIDVEGMNCPFCAYGLKSQLEKLSDIETAEVSLEVNKVRLTLKEGVKANEALYRETIKDAGFSSYGIHHYVPEAHQ